MKTYISILRGINVGGHRKIIMADLKKMYEALGFKEVKTYIQSGNVVFKSDQADTASRLEELLEESIQKTFGHEVPVIIRTPKEWKEAMEESPYLLDHDIATLSLTFLSEEPQAALIDSFLSINYSPDKVSIKGKHAYIFCHGGKFHLSKITQQKLENKLKVKATTRNWKTVLKLKEISFEKQ